MNRIINLLMKYESETYSLAKIERRKVIKHSFGNKNECEVFGRMELLSSKIRGILLSYLIGNKFDKIQETIEVLINSSIYNDKCIVGWIIQYSQDFPKYWYYIQSVENLRIAGVSFLQEELKNKVTIQWSEKPYI